jgi:hypothetical protein
VALDGSGRGVGVITETGSPSAMDRFEDAHIDDLDGFEAVDYRRYA